MSELLFVVVCVSILLLFLMCSNRQKKEGYGTVLGQLAPYTEQLNECINECNREDPDKRFLQQGNINCGVYCESVITEMAQRGLDPAKFPITNNMSICDKQCSTPNVSHNEKRKCMSMCHGQREVAQWCKELWCPYSLYPEESCMKQCISTWNANNNQNSWTWYMEK